MSDSGAEHHEVSAMDDQVRVSPPVSSPSTTVPTSPAPSSTATTAAASQPPTASQKKLCKSSSYNKSDGGSESTESELETYDMYEGKGSRILEVSGIQRALQELCCKKCGGGPVRFKEDIFGKHGLCTHPYFFCENCSVKIPIPFKRMSDKRTYTINRQSVLACKCAGDTLANLQVFCAMLDLPQPVSKNVYTEHVHAICAEAVSHAESSMIQARKEVREHYEATSDDDVVDILVSCDGTWQKRGFISLFGAVFVISFETGKVLDYAVMSKHCASCKHWEKRDKTSEEYRKWKDTHSCDVNFEGSAGAMEPQGTLQLFKSSLDYNLRYTKLISDGDSKTHALLLEEKPYGSTLVEKCDCVGHVQKRMGTALRNLKTKYRGQKLPDGKTIGGVGRLTDARINSLQNYYGDAIRRNKGDLDGMVKSVQATLLHCNSTDDAPRHHLCPEGEMSWCKWQVAKALGKEYHHKEPIPETIVQLIKPIYARLGSRSLLEKCTGGYTQNANEALHSLIWKFCPKELFQGRVGVDVHWLYAPSMMVFRRCLHLCPAFN